MAGWIAGLGEVPDCSSCAALDPANLAVLPDLDWISDELLLGPNLSQTLLRIHRNRPAAARQFFLSLAPGVLNPAFENESDYRTIRLPDAGYQLLALFRYWNMVQYFYPNREIMPDDPDNPAGYWHGVLQDSIRGIMLAPNPLTYQQRN